MNTVVISAGLLFTFILTTSGQQNQSSCCCQDGWITFKGLCYFIGQDTLTWQQARVRCNSVGANLFAPRSVQEWDAIRLHAVRSQWSWIGLSASPSGNPVWESPTTISVDSLPWLVKNPVHGFSSGIKCVAYYAAPDSSLAYINFYDCNLRDYYICQSNSTAQSKVDAAANSTNKNRRRH